MGEVVVVHGGLVPGVELERHHPDHIMTMRSIDEKENNTVLDSPKGTMWAKVGLSLFHIKEVHANDVSDVQ